MAIQKVGNTNVYVIQPSEYDKDAARRRSDKYATMYTSLRWKVWEAVQQDASNSQAIERLDYKAKLDIYEQQRRDLNRSLQELRELKVKTLAGGNTAGQIARELGKQTDRDIEMAKYGQRQAEKATGKRITKTGSEQFYDASRQAWVESPVTTKTTVVEPTGGVGGTSEKELRERNQAALPGASLPTGTTSPAIDELDTEIQRLEQELSILQMPDLSYRGTSLADQRKAYATDVGVMGAGGGLFGLARRPNKELPYFDVAATEARILTDRNKFREGYIETARSEAARQAANNPKVRSLQDAVTEAEALITLASDDAERGIAQQVLDSKKLALEQARNEATRIDVNALAQEADIAFGKQLSAQSSPVPVGQFLDRRLPEVQLPPKPRQFGTTVPVAAQAAPGTTVVVPPAPVPAPAVAAPISPPVAFRKQPTVQAGVPVGNTEADLFGALQAQPPESGITAQEAVQSVPADLRAQLLAEAKAWASGADTGEPRFPKLNKNRLEAGKMPIGGNKPLKFNSEEELISEYLRAKSEDFQLGGGVVEPPPEEEVEVPGAGGPAEAVPAPQAKTHQQRRDKYHYDIIMKGNELAQKKDKMARLAKKDLPMSERVKTVPAYVLIVEKLHGINQGKDDSFQATYEELNRAFADNPKLRQQAHEYLIAYDIMLKDKLDPKG